MTSVPALLTASNINREALLEALEEVVSLAQFGVISSGSVEQVRHLILAIAQKNPE